MSTPRRRRTYHYTTPAKAIPQGRAHTERLSRLSSYWRCSYPNQCWFQNCVNGRCHISVCLQAPDTGGNMLLGTLKMLMSLTSTENLPLITAASYSNVITQRGTLPRLGTSELCGTEVWRWIVSGTHGRVTQRFKAQRNATHTNIRAFFAFKNDPLLWLSGTTAPGIRNR